MTAADYDDCILLWQTAEHVRLSELDDLDDFERFLRRNPHLSLTARQNGHLVGALMAGHDGRIGYLHHVAVAENARRRGIGRTLVRSAIAQLNALEIWTVYAFVGDRNDAGRLFWQALGWQMRDVRVFMTDE